MKTKVRKTKQRRIWFVIALVAITVSVGGYLYYDHNKQSTDVAEEPSLQTTTVRKGDIVLKAMGSGNLVASSEIDLGFRSGGTVVEVSAEVGALVEAGDVLARLDDTAAQLQVAQAELNLEQAKAKLATAMASSDQTLAIAQANREAAKADYDALIQGTQYTGDRLTSTRINLEQAVEQLAFAEAAYNTAYDPGREWELSVKNRATVLENERISATRALAKAQDDLEIARANYNLALLNVDNDGAIQTSMVKLLTAEKSLDDAKSGADIQAAEWAVQQAELSLQTANLALENTVLRSPGSGVIVSIGADVGEAVGTSSIITLIDINNTQVRFYLEESEFNKVALGNTVSVIFDALPDQEFPGHIVRVDPALVTVDGTPAIQAWATLDTSEDSTSLPVGLSAEVTIIAGEAYKTLLVPVQAVRELVPGQFAVFVVDDAGELKLRPVEVGLRDFANAEILSGLQQGEVISTGTVETE